MQEPKQEVSQYDSNLPQKPAEEQPEIKKEDAAPPAGMTSPTAGQPSMFPGPIFIPVPYGQPGGQQGFMAVYPPQVMTGQQGVTPVVQQPAAAPQTVPAPAAQPQTPQQTTAAEPATPTAVSKPRPWWKNQQQLRPRPRNRNRNQHRHKRQRPNRPKR